MVQKFYLDTAIWRDFHENRHDKFRPLGDWAFELFRSIRNNKEIILYSDLVIDELSTDYSPDEINSIFKIARDWNMLEKVEIREEQLHEACILCKKLKIPFGDCIHAILARDNDAIMITRDKHFLEFQHMVLIKKPEDLI